MSTFSSTDLAPFVAMMDEIVADLVALHSFPEHFVEVPEESFETESMVVADMPRWRRTGLHLVDQ